jgi:hypothetical protein
MLPNQKYSTNTACTNTSQHTISTSTTLTTLSNIGYYSTHLSTITFLGHKLKCDDYTCRQYLFQIENFVLLGGNPFEAYMRLKDNYNISFNIEGLENIMLSYNRAFKVKELIK